MYIYVCVRGKLGFIHCSRDFIGLLVNKYYKALLPIECVYCKYYFKVTFKYNSI